MSQGLELAKICVLSLFKLQNLKPRTSSLSPVLSSPLSSSLSLPSVSSTPTSLSSVLSLPPYDLYPFMLKATTHLSLTNVCNLPCLTQLHLLVSLSHFLWIKLTLLGSPPIRVKSKIFLLNLYGHRLFLQLRNFSSLSFNLSTIEMTFQIFSITDMPPSLFRMIFSGYLLT